jgi:hypothetical protein
MKSTVVAAAVALFACSGALAQDPQRNPLLPIESIFAGLIQEQDVALAFRYLRESLDAALEGREPPRADPLMERGEVIAKEAQRRGAATARSMLDMIEGILREAVRDEPRRPPPPFNPMRGI